MRKVKSGFCVMVRKSKVPIFPAAITGAFDALPRKSLLPNFSATIQVVFGDPIQPEDYGDLSEEELTLLVEEKIKECFAKAKFLHRQCHSYGTLEDFREISDSQFKPEVQASEP